MRFKTLFLLALLGMFAFAQSAQAHDTKLHEIMEEIKQNAQTLANQLREAQQHRTSLAGVYETAVKIESLFLAAYQEEPSKAHQFPEGVQKDLFLISYRQHLTTALNKILSLQYTAKEGNVDSAVTQFRELLAFQKEAHDKFQDKE